MTTSVCMGIYNGEKYIVKQLESILHQSKTIDEVILCDDGSQDNTIDIVEHFIHDNGLGDKWKLYCNEKNKGYPGNFYYAMSLCKGDVIFLADQDDIWHTDKVEKMCNVFEGHPDIYSVCCKFGLIDMEENTIHTIMQPTVSKETNKVRNITIEDVFYKCEWPGMVMAYRRKWYEQKVAEWSNENHKIYELPIPHDFLVAAWAAEDNGFLQLDAELAWHRRHKNNVGGEEHRIGKLLNKQHKICEIEKYCNLLRAFALNNILFTKKGQNALGEKTSVMHERYEALKQGKILEIVKNAWKHKKYTRMVTVVCDIIISVIN